MTPSWSSRSQKRSMKTPVPSLQTGRRSALPSRGPSRRVRAFPWKRFDFASPRSAIKLLDRVLRVFLGVQEFTDDPRCILRYSRTKSKAAVTLANGESLGCGEPIFELHFWNDRLGLCFEHGPSRTSLRSALRNSLVLLAHRIRTDKSLSSIKAVYGILTRATSRSYSLHHPFNCRMYISECCGRRGVHDFLEDFLVHLLQWAFNPAGSRIRSLRTNRIEIWISASDLQRAFGDVDLMESFDQMIAADKRHLLTERLSGNTEALQGEGEFQRQSRHKAQERFPLSPA